MSDERGTTYVGPAGSSHQRSSPTCSTTTTWPRTGVTDRSESEQPGAETRAVHHHVAALGERPDVEAGDGAAEVLDPGPQPVQVDRHLDDRGGEGPAVDVPRPQRGRPLQAWDGGRPPGLHLGLGQQLGARHHPHAGLVVVRLAREHLEGARGPGGDLVRREGAIGVPDRRCHGRRRLAREVPGDHVDPVPGLEQPDRAGQSHDARPDHDHPAHGAVLAGALLESGGFGLRRRRPGCGGVGVGTALLAGDVLLDVLDVVDVAGDDGQQVGHGRDLLDLLLDEPLHELLGGEVVLLARDPQQPVDLLGHPLLLREGQRARAR